MVVIIVDVDNCYLQCHYFLVHELTAIHIPLRVTVIVAINERFSLLMNKNVESKFNPIWFWKRGNDRNGCNFKELQFEISSGN